MANASQPSFEEHVFPILKRHCSGCHFPEAERLKSGLDLSTAAMALEGGDEGITIVPGDPAASKFIAMLEHKLEPHMPPPDKGAKLSAEEIETIRAWIAAGAPSDPSVTAADPSQPQTDKALTGTGAIPITALAYSHDGNWLAEGTFAEVRIYEASSAEPAHRLTGPLEMVRALAFSPDGSLLTAGSGAPGRSGDVHIWRTADWSLARNISAHKDIVQSLAVSPDGVLIATASYDKTVRIWDVATGAERRLLKDHVDAVFAVTFSPDGKLLASGAGDRTIKLWDVVSGNMLLTISDSLAAVHTLAFAPASRHLAGAGADKMIRIWDVENLGGALNQSDHGPGTLLRSSFAHDAAILKLAFSPDSQRLYSTAADRQMKAWSAADLTELLTFEPQSDWVTGLAIRPDGKEISVGRYDGTRAVYAADTGASLVAGEIGVASDESGDARKSRALGVEAVIIEATVPPSFASISPARMHRGGEFEVTVSGKNLEAAEPIVNGEGITLSSIEIVALDPPNLKLGEGPRGTGADILDNARPYRIKMKVAVATEASLGAREILFRTPIGLTNGRTIDVISRADIAEAEPNDDIAQAMPVELNSVVSGSIAQAGDVDRYRIAGAVAQEIVVALTDTAFNPAIRLRNEAGAVVATNEDFGPANLNRLGYRIESEGAYILEVSDRDLRGGLGYRLHVGQFPFVTSVSPMGLQAGASQEVKVAGFNLGAEAFVVDPPDNITHDTTVALPISSPPESPIALPRVAVSSRPEASEQEPNDDAGRAALISAPVTMNGRIDKAGDTDSYRFIAKAGEPIVLEVNAERLGSQLDSFIEVLDSNGKRLERGVVRAVAETILTLNNRDSRASGMRLDSWRDFAMNDYLMIGSEIIRVDDLPGYGDEDVFFAAYPNGQRIGFFGTTPEHHAVGAPIYKIEIHPVGSEFAPNGKPIYPLYWENDDGFFGAGDSNGDSQLEFIAPIDGEYIVRIRDAAHRGGERFGYRLALRSWQPDFSVTASPARINVSRGSRVPFDVRVRCVDGFDGPVRVTVDELPAGYSVDGDTVLANDTKVTLSLVAAPDAESTSFDGRFAIHAEGEIGGQTVRRESSIGPITINTVAADLEVQNGETDVALKPGASAWVSVKLDRRNGFNARVPIDVLNLPYGVRVLDTGLNGILVREGEYERSMEIFAEPWVAPMTRTIYIQARIETPSASNPVFVGKPILLQIGNQTTEVAKSKVD